MHIVLLHNPGAGQEEIKRKQLVKAFARQGHDAAYHSTKEESCEQALEDSAELVAVAGGDGTVRKAAKCLAGSDRQLMILPCGTANNIAAQLGIRTGALETIERMEALQPRAFDAGVAQGPWGTETFFEGAGFGMLPQIIPFLKAEAKGRGFPDRYSKIAHHRRLFAQLLKSYKAPKWRLELDGKTVKGKFLLVEILNIGSVGPWLELAPGADPGDGKLDVVCVDKKARDTLDRLLEGEIEAREAAECFKVTRARRVELEWDGSAMHIDSDIWAAGRNGLGKIRRISGAAAGSPVSLSLHPQALRVLVPPKAPADDR